MASFSFIKYFKKLSLLEIILFVLIIVYLLLNVQAPKFMDSFLLSPFGMIILLLVPLYLILFVNPIIGLLSLFVAQRLLAGATRAKQQKEADVQHKPHGLNQESDIHKIPAPNTATNEIADIRIATPNVEITTLESDVVGQMAPIGQNNPDASINSSYRPITLDDHRPARP